MGCLVCICMVLQSPETSGCNSQTGYKTKLLKHGEAGQQCKKHTPIGFSGKYAIKFALAVQNKKMLYE